MECWEVPAELDGYGGGCLLMDMLPRLRMPGWVVRMIRCLGALLVQGMLICMRCRTSGLYRWVLR